MFNKLFAATALMVAGMFASQQNKYSIELKSNHSYNPSLSLWYGSWSPPEPFDLALIERARKKAHRGKMQRRYRPGR
jgi:hypothetical protein